MPVAFTLARAKRALLLATIYFGALFFDITYVIPLLVPDLARLRGYNELQKNVVTAASGVGAYAMLPIFGMLSDRYGPHWVALVGAAMYFTGYYSLAALYGDQPFATSYQVAVMFSFILGLAGSSMAAAYSTFITQEARPALRGIMLGAWMAMLTLSSSVFAFIERWFVDTSNGRIDMQAFLSTMAYICAGLGALVTFGMYWRPPGDVLNADKTDDDTVIICEGPDNTDIDELSPLLHCIDKGAEQSLEHCTPNRMAIFKDVAFILLCIALSIFVGSVGVYANNVSSLARRLLLKQNPNATKDQIHSVEVLHPQLISLANSAAYITIGVLSGQLAKRMRHSEHLFLLLAALLTTLAHVFAIFVEHLGTLVLISILEGIGTGSFGLAAALLCVEAWGSAYYAFNYGLIMVALAIAGQVFGALFGFLVDRAISQPTGCDGRHCYTAGFTLLCVMCIVGLCALVGAIWRLQRAKDHGCTQTSRRADA
ncbi:major facilitator superfamily domain-containing protein [Thamnocephalis sphaerospora]|uniref:Major facilitator superfamily domain-containing protein n=1 Tax=Thamnocephalis sphaerospora TaxID=78915 RepID=A0A4P9XS73_9FUNG|nr:major facilitator superfamily domain-containing protein [Thamnocephalis sphaerospora]|eukprot:RKP08955.1 major facilitator superfamily domain-containing protein [Thamnocephalis sphaerospora]